MATCDASNSTTATSSISIASLFSSAATVDLSFCSTTTSTTTPPPPPSTTRTMMIRHNNCTSCDGNDDAVADAVEVGPNHAVTATTTPPTTTTKTKAAAPPTNPTTIATATAPTLQIQLGTFDSFVSDLSWDSFLLEHVPRLPPPMAYYAVPTILPPPSGDHNNSATNNITTYPRRCFFTGRIIVKHAPYYAGCIVQGRRTLVVFCHVDALPSPPPRHDESATTMTRKDDEEEEEEALDATRWTTTAAAEATATVDLGTRLARRYPTATTGLSKATVWQSYNAVCHWSGLPIHTDRDVHYRWRRGHVLYYLAEVVVDVVSSSAQHSPTTLLAELQGLSDRYEARVPAIVLVSLTYWEWIDPTTAKNTTSLATATTTTTKPTTCTAPKHVVGSSAVAPPPPRLLPSWQF
jgi:hypothetical protein